MNTEDDLLILGDFNLTDLIWVESDEDSVLIALNASTPQERTTIDNFTDCGLQQISNIKNHQNKQLDLVFSSDACNCTVEESLVAVCNIDDYHPPLSITFAYENGILNKDTDNTYCFNFRKADFTHLENLLNDVDFERITEQEDIDVQDFQFLCPNATIFDQTSQICANWADVTCGVRTTSLKSSNFNFYRLMLTNAEKSESHQMVARLQKNSLKKKYEGNKFENGSNITENRISNARSKSTTTRIWEENNRKGPRELEKQNFDQFSTENSTIFNVKAAEFRDYSKDNYTANLNSFIQTTRAYNMFLSDTGKLILTQQNFDNHSNYLKSKITNNQFSTQGTKNDIVTVVNFIKPSEFTLPNYQENTPQTNNLERTKFSLSNYFMFSRPMQLKSVGKEKGVNYNKEPKMLTAHSKPTPVNKSDMTVYNKKTLYTDLMGKSLPTTFRPFTYNKIIEILPKIRLETTTIPILLNTYSPAALLSDIINSNEDDGQYHPELYERTKTGQRKKTKKNLVNENELDDELLQTAHSSNIAAGARFLNNINRFTAKQNLKINRNLKPTSTPSTNGDVSYDYAYYDSFSTGSHDYELYDIISDFKKTKYN